MPLTSLSPFAPAFARFQIKIPIVGKTETIQMPPCPLLTKGNHFHNTTSLKLPSKSPIPAKTGIKGTVSLTDQAGVTVVKIAVDISVSKNSMLKMNTQPHIMYTKGKMN